MTYQYDGYNWLVKLKKGELLIESLTKLVQDEHIKGAWVAGLGAAMGAELGYYELETQQYHWKKLEEELEITSLQGNVAWRDGEPVLHIHGTFSRKDMSAVGGHVKELTVGGTCEILLHRWYETDGLSRSLDEETGLTLLDV